jgi:tetratricopeptide (TPR) repeat protein
MSEADPSSPRSVGDLLRAAFAAWSVGHFGEAEGLSRQILIADPGSLPAKHLLGMIAGQTGRTSLAIDLLREVAAADPNGFVALNQLAILLRGQGRATEAVGAAKRASVLKPDDPATLENLGQCLLADGRAAEAIDAFERVVRLKADSATGYYGLASALAQLARDREAAQAFERAINLAPGYAEAHAQLGRLLQGHGRQKEAIAQFRKAAEARPNSAFAHLQFARIDLEEGRAESAKDRLGAALALEPDSADIHALLGNALQQLGDFDGAIAAYEKVIEQQPARVSAYLGIVSAKKVSEADRSLLAQMQALLRQGNLAEMDAVNLHYGLGKAEDDLADYGSAMAHYDEANRLMAARLVRSGRAFDCKRHQSAITRLIDAFTPEFFHRYRGLGTASELPVFVLGMMRSGTTLIEQILSSHPKIGGGGELDFWGDREAMQERAAAGTLDPPTAVGLAANYMDLLRGIAPSARRVTDKMPANFLLLGLIHLLFPRARIIHCRRDPVDTCISIYTTPYTQSPHFAHDRANIVFYYEQYLRLMAHWRNVLPADRFLEVDYEDIVGDREIAARRLVEFCGLDWNDACLRHENNRRSVKTASAWQARQPLYRSSVERWRRYEPWLGEFRKLLGERGAMS